MSLKPLPIDPRPTSEELDKYRQEMASQYQNRRCLNRIAYIKWRSEKRLSDPDAFIVHFPPFKHLAYKHYRKTQLWKNISNKVLSTANYECAGCENKATDVHHRDYRPRVMAGEDLSYLVPLCRTCHDKIHKYGNEETWNEIELALAALVNAKDSCVR